MEPEQDVRKTKEIKNIWNYIISIIIGIIIGILINIPSCQKYNKPKIEYIEKHDTITVEKERIVEKTRTKYINRIDTFYVKESGDTIRVDSIPIEHKIYEDTIKTDSTSTEIKIEYSGFNPEINNIWLQHNYFEKEVTIVKKPKKIDFVWAFGIGGGFGGDVNINNGTVGYGPQIGAFVIIGIGGPIRNGR